MPHRGADEWPSRRPEHEAHDEDKEKEAEPDTRRETGRRGAVT